MILEKNWLKAIVIFLIIVFLSIAISSLETAYQKALNFPETFDFENKTIPQLEAALPYFLKTTFLLSVIFTLISFVLTTPLSLGQTEWYWRLTKQKPQGVEGIFAWFGSIRLFAKSLWLRINIMLRLLPWFLLTVGIPYCLLFVSMLLTDAKSSFIVEFAVLFLIFAQILLIGGLLLFLYIATRYFLAPYLLVEDNSRKVNRCVKDSVKYTNGQRGDIYAFWFSFAGWFILCLFVLPILYVLPYFNAASAIYAKFIIYSERLKDKNVSDKTEEFEPKLP